jgi:Flp pilus assembly protein TadD
MEAATKLHVAGRLADAEAAYRRILAANPDLIEALHLCGVAAFQLGHAGAAEPLIRRALSLAPGHAEMYSNFGCVLRALGRRGEATAALRQALALRPDLAAAHAHLADLLCNDVATLPESLTHYDAAVRGTPGDDDLRLRRAAALFGAGRYDDSAAAYLELIARYPRVSGLHANLGAALRAAGHFDEVLACHEHAVALDPGDAHAHWLLALELLGRGDFARGWREYEWRWRWDDFPAERRSFPGRPRWDGSPLAGRTLFLHSEQGLGDMLQFARYVPLLVERGGGGGGGSGGGSGGGGRVVVECAEPLVRLYRSVPGVAEVVRRGDAPPPFDAYLPMISLPLMLGTNSIDAIPRNVPYVRPTAVEVAAWRERVQAAAGPAARMKVGLAWAASAMNPKRSVTLPRLAPLAAAAPEATFFSLQKGPESADASSPPPGMRLIDFTADLRDLADTAALIENLDLVIAVDTAVAHLAGATGKPAWTLLPFVPDWRWMLGRADSAWYPTMRLFRQRTMDAWDEPVAEVAAALAAL